MSKAIFQLVHDQARENALRAVQKAPEGYVVEVKEKTRSLAQNARLWALLTDVADQVIWHGRKLNQDEWKNMFTAALLGQDVIPNIDGNGFVAMGRSTSRMTVKEMTDLQTLIEAFGSNNGVEWTQ